jgi:hypothetical protein
MNDYGKESLQALRDAVDRIWQSVTSNDAAQFTNLMHQGREYLAGRVREQ